MSNSNGLTIADYDRDGDLDVLMGSVAANGVLPPTGVEQLHLYENEIGRRNNSLQVTLHGITANRQGIGARVYVTAGRCARSPAARGPSARLSPPPLTSGSGRQHAWAKQDRVVQDPRTSLT